MKNIKNMEKVIRLTESDLIRVVKKVILEQTQPQEFKINNTNYIIKKITKLDTAWSQIEFVKVLPNGMEERKLNIGFIHFRKSKTIYTKKDIYSETFGISNIDLITPYVEPNRDEDMTGHYGKRFMVGSDIYEVKKITKSPPNEFFRIGYFKVLPNGELDSNLKVGFILPLKNPKFIYSTQSKNDSNKIGPIIFSTEMEFYIEQLKNGLSQIFKNEQIELSNNVLSVGDKMKLELSDDKIVRLSIPHVKTIDKQTLSERWSPLDIKFVTLGINKVLSTVQTEFNKLIKKQRSEFKTTVEKRKPTIKASTTYRGTEFKP